MVAVALKVTPYARRNRRAVLNLVNDGRCRLHTHLDWQLIEEWLDMPDTPVFLGWQESRLVGVIAASPPLDGASWLRLAAVDEYASVEVALPELWTALRERLHALGVAELAALVMQSWLGGQLGALGFEYREHIVTLHRDGIDAPAPLRTDVRIRPADVRDVETTLGIDHAAFGPLWRMHPAAMRFAARESGSFTIAELNGHPVGYQLTTTHYRNAHLARLAVIPRIQGGGVGGALLGHLIDSLARRGIASLSVNTQGSNTRSLNLYRCYGFTPNGNNIPCWTARLEE